MSDTKKPSLSPGPVPVSVSPEPVESPAPPASPPPPIEDTFESPGPTVSVPVTEQFDLHRDYNTEIAVLKSLGYSADALTSETLITEFFLARAEKLEKPGLNYKRLSHEVRRRLGSTREEDKAALISAARTGTISAVLPGVCHEHTLFPVQGSQLSRLDIKRTIAIISQMESLIIKGLVAGLTQNHSPKRRRNYKIAISIPHPDEPRKTTLVRFPEDSQPSVKERFLNPARQNALLQLARKLPAVRSRSGDKRASFKEEAIKLLSQEEIIPFHEIRRLLPINETGSLKSGASEVRMEGQTSREIKKYAQRMGAIPEDD